MKIHRIDHVGINVVDIAAAKQFFLDFGLEVEGEGDFGGELFDRVTQLDHVQDTIVMMRTPDGAGKLELVQFHTPKDENGIQLSQANTLGIRHISFAVQDIEGLVAKMKQKGMKMFSEIQNYENFYKVCYVRGPEGIILELAEKIHK